MEKIMENSEEKYWKKVWKNVQTSAEYGAAGGRLLKDNIRGSTPRELTITLDDIKQLWIEQDGRCYWLGIRMSLEDVMIKDSPFAVSVERLDNSRGYIEGNIVLASRFANRGRGAYDNDDFLDRLNALLSERTGVEKSVTLYYDSNNSSWYDPEIRAAHKEEANLPLNILLQQYYGMSNEVYMDFIVLPYTTLAVRMTWIV